ncbi:hypothetical protein ACS0TY_032596 [Phlomoides rotata]
MNHFILINLFTFLYVIANIAQAFHELTQQSFGQKKICWFSRKFVVHVINNLPSNSEMRIHCASGDDDLGYHTLPVGDDFNWSFCEIPYTTLFFCHFWWDSDSKERAFEVYDSHIRANLCLESGECFWSARDDGIYTSGYPDGRDYEITLYWRKLHTSRIMGFFKMY